MRAIVNLKYEPRLREAFEHGQVVNNTVLIDRHCLGLRDAGGTGGGVMQAWSCRQTGRSGDACGPGYPLISAVASSLRNRSYPYRLRSLRSLRAPLANRAERSADRLADRAGPNRRWGPCRGRELANRRDLPLCHTCSLRQPCGSSAPLRRGKAPLGIGPGRPWLGPNLR